MAESAHQYRKNGREIVVAKLTHRVTADGLLELFESVPIGQKYVVYREPVRMEGFNFPKRTAWERDMYECVEGGWLPCELLEIEE